MFFRKDLKKNLLFFCVLLVMLMQMLGLTSWDSVQEYQAGKEVVYKNKIYRAKLGNINKVPIRYNGDIWMKIGNVNDYSDKQAPSKNAPGNIPIKKTPMFIVLGFDDNYIPSAMNWVLDLLREYDNPSGNDNDDTFDGEPIKVTFFQPGTSLWHDQTIFTWYQAMIDGHETANHTVSHNDPGVVSSVDNWYSEIQGLNDILVQPLPVGIGISESEITGFRAPALFYNNNTFKAIKKHYMLYDSSIEEGWHPSEDGTNYWWPYTLDFSSPGNEIFALAGIREKVEPVPGLWELPVYALVTPTDKECEKYNIEPGLRTRCSGMTTWFEMQGYKISGLDWCVREQYQLDGNEYSGLLKYNLDKRLEGNRAPFIFILHSNYYNDLENRKALKKFIKYALQKKSVRFVTSKQLIKWMKNPVELEN